MDIALAHNPELHVSQETLKQYEYAVQKAGSALLPQLSGSAGAGHSKSVSGAQQDSYSVGLSFSQLLYDGSKTQTELDQARLDLLSNRAAYQYASATLRNSLRKAFIEVYQAQELVRISSLVLARRKQQYELISLKYEAGREHKGSLLRSRASLTQAQQNCYSTQRNLELRQKKLAVKLGIQDVKLTVSENLVSTGLSLPADLTALGLENPYYRQYKLEKLGQEMALKSAQANQGASLQANASYGLSDSRILLENNSWSVGLVASYPVWDGGKLQAQVDTAVSALRSASENEIAKLQTVLLSLEEARTNYLNAKGRVIVETQFLEASEARSIIGEAQYTTGQLGYDGWMLIENELVADQESLVNAKAALLSAEADWILAKGGTLEDEK